MTTVNIASPATIREVLEETESFIAGFENDELQEGIDYLLRRVRTAIATFNSTNSERVAHAEAALATYTRRTRCDRPDSLGDLLCDLMHWAHANDFDYDLALDRARMHFEAEVQP